MTDTEPARKAQARTEIQAILNQPEYENVPFRLAKDWGINSSHFSRLFAKDVLSDYLDDLLVEKGMLEKRPPKDPRPRVWMRTDDIDMAVETLFGQYNIRAVFEAIVRYWDGRYIVSVECVRSPRVQPEYAPPDSPYLGLNLPNDQIETASPQNQAEE